MINNKLPNYENNEKVYGLKNNKTLMKAKISMNIKYNL